MAQLEQEPVMCSKTQATFDMGSKTHTILWMQQGLVGPPQSLSAIYPPCTTCARKDHGWWQQSAENPLLTVCPFFANNPSTHRACQVAFHTDIWRRCQAIKHDSVFYFCYFFCWSVWQPKQLDNTSPYDTPSARLISTIPCTTDANFWLVVVCHHQTAAT